MSKNKIFKKAFTLIELLVVMAIMGILIAVAIIGIGIAQRGSRNSSRQSDLNNVKAALESYYGTNKKYPTSITLNNSIVTLPSASGGSASNVNLNQPSTSNAVATVNFSTTDTSDTISSNCKAAANGAGVTSASTWNIAYGTESGTSKPQRYALCGSQESGDVFDLSSK